MCFASPVCSNMRETLFILNGFPATTNDPTATPHLDQRQGTFGATIPPMSPPSLPSASVREPPELLDDGRATDTTLSEALITLRKRRLVLLTCVLLGIAFGIYRAYTQPRLYYAFAEIQVRSGASAEYKVDAAQGLSADASNKLAAEVVILQSNSLMITVARTMNLCNNPDFLGVRGPIPYQSLDTPEVRESTIRRLHQQLKVALIPKTDIIKLTYSSLNPKLSADIVNQVVAAYIQRSYETRYLSTQRVSQLALGATRRPQTPGGDLPGTVA